MVIALFIITKSWKQLLKLKCPSAHEWINKIQHYKFYTMEYYLAIKRNKLLIHITKWMNHKNIM